jgi:lipid II:glycine glycyltransferase (peptidoglycan interpeptide bridge formation enzyme)
MNDLRQTPQYAEYIKLLGWNVEKVEGSYVFIRKIPILGSVVKLQRPEQLSKRTIIRIDKIGKKARAFQVSIEPSKEDDCLLLTNSGYKLSKSPSLCSKTVQIDLRKSEKVLLSEMHHKTRYNIKKAKSKKIKLRVSNDIDKFADFWQKCAFNQRGMFLSMKNEIKLINASFGNNAHVLTVTESKSILAAILLILTKNAAYYMYAASTKEGKRMYAPTLVAWESIKLAKKVGRKMYDFEGIFDTRFPLPNWKGFSRFKKSFGGNEIEYPGNFVKYRIPF